MLTNPKTLTTNVPLKSSMVGLQIIFIFVHLGDLCMRGYAHTPITNFNHSPPHVFSWVIIQR